jgi:hypothetical protein
MYTAQTSRKGGLPSLAFYADVVGSRANNFGTSCLGFDMLRSTGSNIKILMKRTSSVKNWVPAAVASASLPGPQSRQTDAVAKEEFAQMNTNSSSSMALIPNFGNGDTEDDVMEVPMPRICAPFRRHQAGTRSVSRSLMEGLRSVLVNAFSPGARAGFAYMVLGDDGGRDDMDPEEATVYMMAHQSTSMSASSSTRHSREDVDLPTTLSDPSVAMSPHSVSSSALTYSHPAPILTDPASTRAQLPSGRQASSRGQDRSKSLVSTLTSQEVGRREAVEEESYRALRSHQLLTQHAAAADGGSALHPMYWQDHAVNPDKFLDRDFVVSPCMMKLLEYPTLRMLKSDSALRSADDSLRVGVAHGCVNSADRRPRGHGSAFMNPAKVVSRHVSMNNLSLPRKLEGLVGRTLSEDYRCAHYRSPVGASRFLVSARGPHRPPGGVIPFRRVDAARRPLAQCRQDGTNPIMTIPVSALHSLYLDSEHRGVHADHCPPPVGGVLDMAPHALYRMSVHKFVHPDALSRAYAHDLLRLQRVRPAPARSTPSVAALGSIEECHCESSDSYASAPGSQGNDVTDHWDGLRLSPRLQPLSTDHDEASPPPLLATSSDVKPVHPGPTGASTGVGLPLFGTAHSRELLPSDANTDSPSPPPRGELLPSTATADSRWFRLSTAVSPAAARDVPPHEATDGHLLLPSAVSAGFLPSGAVANWVFLLSALRYRTLHLRYGRLDRTLPPLRGGLRERAKRGVPSADTKQVEAAAGAWGLPSFPWLLPETRAGVAGVISRPLAPNLGGASPRILQSTVGAYSWLPLAVSSPRPHIGHPTATLMDALMRSPCGGAPFRMLNRIHISGLVVFLLLWWQSRLTRWLYAGYHAALASSGERTAGCKDWTCLTGPRSIAHLLKHQDLALPEPAVLLPLANHTA